MHNNPIIYSGHAVKRTKPTPAGDSGNKYHAVAPPPEVTEQKCDLLIYDLWQKETESVHKMQVVNTDAQYYGTMYPKRFLKEAKRGKKRMYLEA